MRRREFIALAAGAMAGWPLALRAQSAPYPNQTVRIVVPVTAGSTADILARTVADRLGPQWNQTVIVENRPGVPGILSVAKGPTDGYSIMLTSNGHSAVGPLNKGLTFDPVADLAGVAQVAVVPLVLIVPLTFAGRDRRRADRARQGEARHAELCLGRARQHQPSRRRGVQTLRRP